jgi:hypothetical protein
MQLNYPGCGAIELAILERLGPVFKMFCLLQRGYRVEENFLA